MADEWLGFERRQVLDWFEQAGLVNRLVDCTGEDCCATHAGDTGADEPNEQARISVFAAVGTKRVNGAREHVQEQYAARARTGAACCGSGSGVNICCASPDNPDSEGVNIQPDYAAIDTTVIPEEAAGMALGCGNPTALALLQPGEVVVDIGSGGGLDCFLASRQVGEKGKVIGVDMTPVMLGRARQAARRMGIANVEFRKGTAEALPLPDGSADVVMSNCVINLCEDKGQVFNEAFRVLKPGGRLEISDIVASGSFPGEVSADPSRWGDCIFGAIPEGEYLALLRQAGFSDPQVQKRAHSGDVFDVAISSLTLTAAKPSTTA
ncbi:MAG: arsenite methyltransferase [Anaerolineae bacterium]|nr:arsenite methyltransferase [Anaerolineae bacterium]